MKPGTQIAYVPSHVNGDIRHPDVQFGFVTSERDNAHFCRYWTRGKEGNDLRTKANSELTPNKYLVQYKAVSQDHVDSELNWIVEAA